MGSNGLAFGLVSGGCSLTEQYDWHQLALRQREQAMSEQPCRGATLNCPAHAQSRADRRRSSSDRACDRAKGADGHTGVTARLGNAVPHNQGSSTQSRQYDENRNLPTESLGGHFSDIDGAKHRSYMDRFRTYDDKPDHTSAGRPCHGDEVSKAHTKKPSNDLHPTHPEQLELSSSKDLRGYLDIIRSRRNAYSGKLLRTKEKRSLQKSSSNGGSVSRHERNSRQRYGDELPVQRAKSDQKRHGDQLAGHKSKKHMAYGEQPKVFCSPDEQDQKPYHHRGMHLDVMGNDKLEGKAEEAYAATCCGSTKSNENSGVLSPKYSSKTIASSSGPKPSEGSINMKLEPDKQPSVVGCTKRPRNMRTEDDSRCNTQILPATHLEKTDNTSQSEILRECLILWRRRKLRKEAEKAIQTGAAKNGRYAASDGSESDDDVSESESASGSSGSPHKNDTKLHNAKKHRSAMPSDGVLKGDEGRAKRKLEQPFRCLSGSNYNKISQNKIAEQDLKCNLEDPPEANPGEITQQKEKNKLPCRLLSTAHPDAMVQTDQNSCSDTSKIRARQNSTSYTSKVGEAAASHPVSGVSEKVSQHEVVHDQLAARRKHKVRVSCDIGKKAEDREAKCCEQLTNLSTCPTQLDQKNVALCSLHDGNAKVLGPECSNQESKTTPSFGLSKCDKLTAGNHPDEPVILSSGSDCGDTENCSEGSDCRYTQGDNMNCNILRNEQVSSALADSEKNMHRLVPSEATKVTSNGLISHQSNDHGPKIDVAIPAHQTSGFAIPDLNCLPSMVKVEEEVKASEDLVNQVTGEGSKAHIASRSSSAAFSGPTVQEEQFKQPEANESMGGTCKREDANGSRISDSHSVPPQRSTVEESSTSFDAFKCALCEFIKNILRPLWDDGLLSREVHRMIVKKAVDKVTVALGSKVPVTEIAISKFLLDPEESQNLEKLVQGYLDLYLGSQVLKRAVP